MRLLGYGEIRVNYILAEFLKHTVVKLEAGVDAIDALSVIQEFIAPGAPGFRMAQILLYDPQRWIASFANRTLTPRKNNA